MDAATDTAESAPLLDRDADGSPDAAASDVVFGHANAPRPISVKGRSAPGQDLSFRDAVGLYPAAIAWSAFVSVGVVMLAFDPQLLGNLYATPQFRRDFGYEYNGEYIISASWQTSLSICNPIGQILGALVGAIPMDRYGRKPTFAACVCLVAFTVLIQFRARSLPILLAGELAGGLVLGVFVVIAPAYASEVCPTALRGHLTSYVNLCFVAGQLLANAVTAATAGLENHWAYSLPFALQWVWIALLLPGLALVPESPWWLVRKGRVVDAAESLRRLASPQVDGQAALEAIVATDRAEREAEAGSAYADCFKGVDLRRTEIAVGVYCTQVVCGVCLVNYGTYFFLRAGLPTEMAFDMGILFLAVGFVGTVLSWFLLLRHGRREIYNTGLAILVLIQLLIGLLDCVPSRPAGIAWAESGLMLLWNFVYDMTVGPVCFVLLAECSAVRLRSKTIALATAAQGILTIGMDALIPLMINPDHADLRGKIGFVFAALGGLALLWAHLRVPETAGRSYDELDFMFASELPARQFKGYRFGEDGMALAGSRNDVG